ncbi:MAG TPA: SRPBCC family protein [Edaphobacter sp.]|nr:SRPBCC family protein [Edaphobacter sp.]
MKQHSGETSSRSSYGLPFGTKSILVGAGALIAYGFSRRSKTGAALATAGGVLAFRAITSKANAAHSSARASFLLNASPQKAYDLWRNFENLPRFMSHLKSVRVLDGNHSEWIARGPLDQDVRWNAEITEDRQNERISWRALPGSDVENSGFVEFRADPQNRGTFVTAEVRYDLPGGSLGVGLATLLGKNPDFVVREDLRRFKALVEAGETPTTVGQTHGPRGIHGYSEQILFRETNNHPQPQAPPKLPRSA